MSPFFLELRTSDSKRKKTLASDKVGTESMNGVEWKTRDKDSEINVWKRFASNSDILGTKRDIDVNRKKYRRANIALSNTINSISKLLIILKLWSFEFHDSWFFCSYNNMYNSSILSFWNSISIQVPKNQHANRNKIWISNIWKIIQIFSSNVSTHPP